MRVPQKYERTTPRGKGLFDEYVAGHFDIYFLTRKKTKLKSRELQLRILMMMNRNGKKRERKNDANRM